jgi:HlyD family secretion protein
VVETILKKLILLLVVLAAAAAIVWGILRKNEPPRVSFARVKRQTLVSTLPSNGKVEPYEWRSVHAESGGIVSRMEVHEGSVVAEGDALAVISDPAIQAEFESAEAKLAEARANLEMLEAGAKPVELAAIDASLSRARLDLQQTSEELAAQRRLVEKQAATRADAQTLQDKVSHLQLEIQNLEKRRSLPAVQPPEIVAAKARLRDAEAAFGLARRRTTQGAVRAPIAGVVYGLAIKQGSYITAGDLIANIGRLDRVRVRVYVDEPELGRVALGQPVTIRWQAMTGKEWAGTVERKPTSIQALGSRQVGEVICTIDNHGRELAPGANVDTEIRTAVVEHALVIPREALRHDAAGDYVFLLHGDTIERRAVKPGAASITQVEAGGLAEADAVALPSDVAVKPGDRVTAAF